MSGKVRKWLPVLDVEAQVVVARAVLADCDALHPLSVPPVIW